MVGEGSFAVAVSLGHDDSRMRDEGLEDEDYRLFRDSIWLMIESWEQKNGVGKKKSVKESEQFGGVAIHYGEIR